jgi:hypothetical protein
MTAKRMGVKELDGNSEVNASPGVTTKSTRDTRDNQCRFVSLVLFVSSVVNVGGVPHTRSRHDGEVAGGLDAGHGR